MMIHTSVPDQIDAPTAIILAAVLWVVFILIILIQKKRIQVRRAKKARAEAFLNRREAFIKKANETDELYYEELKKNPQKRDNR